MPAMDKLPRVPDAHGDIVDEKLFSDLYIRTSWVDANVALDQIKKVITEALIVYPHRRFLGVWYNPLNVSIISLKPYNKLEKQKKSEHFFLPSSFYIVWIMSK